MKKVLAYHWSRNDDCLGYGDGRQIVLGETLSVEGTPVICSYGLHGSISVVDALGYAAGSHLWLVEISGQVQTSDDKICGQNRKAVIEYGDLLLVIVDFAFWCAERAGKYAGKSAAKSAAEYAGKSAEYAKSAAEYAAEYAGKSAGKSAEYAAKSAEYAAESEKLAQENWWNEKLQQLKG